MKRVLIIGNSPLPEENTSSRPAAGLRTNQFLTPLLKKGGMVVRDKEHAFSAETRPQFKVQLVTIAMPECYDQKIEPKEIVKGEHFSHFLVSKDDRSLKGSIQKIHDEFQPEVIIGVNTYPSYIASGLDSLAPLWADLNGWIIAEAQAQASKSESNDYLGHYHKIEQQIIKRADKFSTVSMAQKFALIGELADAGRMNKETFTYEFAHEIPNGTVFFEDEKEILEGGEVKKLRNVPEDAFVLLWMGGYNTWVDERTLFKGVEDAMKKCDRLYFVSTGGGIKGLDNKTFASFKKMIEESEFKERFVFLGWVETKAIPYIYKRANAGLNVDRMCVETMTGARNRINEMMKFEVPVITTLGSEISYEAERVNAGIGVPSGRPELLNEAICRMYNLWLADKKILKGHGRHGREYIKKECNYDKIQRPLMKWLENPRPAPDQGVDVKFGSSALIKSGIGYFRKNGLRAFLKKLWQSFGR